jgi:GT2 family glycosyltransferase
VIYNLTCVIVNWNLKEDTLKCVRSLLEAGATPGKMIVVDNGSTDGSSEALEEAFRGAVKVIQSDRNLGFSGGYNLGIWQALQTGAKWVLMINNDTWVAPDFLENLCSTAEAYPQYALFGPMILYATQPERIWFLGDRLIPGLLSTRSMDKNRVARNIYPSILQVDFLNGCAILIRTQIFQEIGFFDENLFMYGEEVDFCWRARQAGFRLAAIPAARMWHKVSASANREQSRSRYLRTRNQTHFYRKYGHHLQIPPMLVFTFLRLIKISVGDLLQGRQMLIPPMVHGWIDGWLGRPLRMEDGYGRG